MGWQEQLRAARAATDRAIKQRTADLQRFADGAEARGRQVYANAIKTGERVLARTPAELRALGIAAAQGRLPQAVGEAAGKAVVKAVKHGGAAPPPAKRSATSGMSKGTPRTVADQVVREGGAAVRGAIDEATFGLADKGSAAAQALVAGGLDGFGERYAKEIAAERAADAYDEEHHGLARGAGRVVGFVGSLAATGGAGAAVKAGARALSLGNAGTRAAALGAKITKAAEAANYTKRIAPLGRAGLTPLAVGGGAAAGVAGQAVSDALGGRRSNLKDYAGAALGGATAGLMLRTPRLGTNRVADGLHRMIQAPMTAGGVEGAATAAYQGVLNGRDVGLEEIAQAARAGAIGARIGDVAGKYGTNAASRNVKEAIGDNLSIARSIAAGEGVELIAHLGPKRAPWRSTQRRQVKTDLPGGGYTWADHVTPNGKAVEAKFGRHADLSYRQKQARRELPHGEYRIDHWLPSDVGRMGSVAFGAVGSHPWEGHNDR